MDQTGAGRSGAGRPGPGRPRSERARLAILDAAADLLIEGGLAAATMEAIAARAGVSKVTIYKWWPSRGAVAVDAYFHRYRPEMGMFDSGDLARDLTAQIALMVDAFRGRAGAIMAELIGAAQTDAALADQLRALWIQPRRDAGTVLIQGAIDRGELRPDLDIQIGLDQLFGPLYFRLLVRHLPLDDPMPAALVRAFLDGARSKP
ncbi:hypothetical protein ACG83_15410 [Frankia sp. R43]|nr:hypothetical protein ACG83_15410 [Frankia sp. R43]